MVLLQFVLDLPRLSYRSIEDIKQFLLDVAEEYVRSSLLPCSADKIALFYITNDHDHVVMNVACGATDYTNFDSQMFQNAVENLPSVPEELGSKISAGDLHEILSYQLLDTTVNALITKEIIIITSTLPQDPQFFSAKSRLFLMRAKESCAFFEFVLVDHQAVFPEIDNCAFIYWPADPGSRQRYVKASVKRMHDDSGDLRYILVPVAEDTREFDSIVQVFENEKEEDMEVGILSVYRILSAAVRARLEAFPAVENTTPLLQWYPATMAEIHSIVVNGFDMKTTHSFGTLAEALSGATTRQEGDRHVVACSCLVSERHEELISPVYLVACKFPLEVNRF